jgi:hypothetical protein
VLAVAYVLRLEDLRREVDSLNMAAGMSAMFGGSGERVSWEAVKAEFDADLAAAPDDQPEPATTGRGIRLRALGFE